MQRIASLAISGSREGGVRSETCTCLARTVPSDRQVWGHAMRLEIAGTPYQVFPVVHVSKLKLGRLFPDRPMEQLRISESDRVDFDEALLPEDSWVGDLAYDEF